MGGGRTARYVPEGGGDLIASTLLPETSQPPDYGMPYWRSVASCRRARGWLCLVGSLTILAGFLIGSDYAISMEFLKSLTGLALVIAGILYLSCARRMERGGRLPGLLALGVAVLQSGALMIVAALAAREMVMWEWHLGDPTHRGMVLGTEPNWAALMGNSGFNGRIHLHNGSADRPHRKILERRQEVIRRTCKPGCITHWCWHCDPNRPVQYSAPGDVAQCRPCPASHVRSP